VRSKWQKTPNRDGSDCHLLQPFQSIIFLSSLSDLTGKSPCVCPLFSYLWAHQVELQGKTRNFNFASIVPSSLLVSPIPSRFQSLILRLHVLCLTPALHCHLSKNPTGFLVTRSLLTLLGHPPFPGILPNDQAVSNSRSLLACLSPNCCSRSWSGLLQSFRAPTALNFMEVFYKFISFWNRTWARFLD